jgi:hypothetical protein
MAKPHDQDLTGKGPARQPKDTWKNAIGLGARNSGVVPKFSQFWVLKLYNIFLLDFKLVFGRFCPLLEDLEPFLRPDLGRKLGSYYQLQTYIKHRFLAALDGFRRGKML